MNPEISTRQTPRSNTLQREEPNVADSLHAEPRDMDIPL